MSRKSKKERRAAKRRRKSNHTERQPRATEVLGERVVTVRMHPTPEQAALFERALRVMAFDDDLEHLDGYFDDDLDEDFDDELDDLDEDFDDELDGLDDDDLGDEFDNEFIDEDDLDDDLIVSWWERYFEFANLRCSCCGEVNDLPAPIWDALMSAKDQAARRHPALVDGLIRLRGVLEARGWSHSTRAAIEAYSQPVLLSPPQCKVPGGSRHES